MVRYLHVLMLMAALMLVGCGSSQPAAPATPATLASNTITPPIPSPIPTQTLTPPTVSPSPTAIPTQTATPEPFGCLKPSDDYTRVDVNGWTVNQRTLAMLAHAQQLYDGEIELTGHAITQGSYHDNGAASFGTHLGGGALDLSVLRRGTYTVLWDDIPLVLHALRAAGFAAWLREYGEVYPDSPIHIHAIAIGDRELSTAAQEQLIGPAGYFRGLSGLPFGEGGSPTPDRHGGPILCQWMIDLGYRDLR